MPANCDMCHEEWLADFNCGRPLLFGEDRYCEECAYEAYKNGVIEMPYDMHPGIAP